MSISKSPIDIAADLSARRRFRSALKMLEQTRDMSNKPGVSLICTYNLGTIHWSELGNGLAARDCFMEAVNIARSGHLPIEDDTVRILLANSCENLMLLSLSYGEYEDWSSQLWELQPNNDILRGQVPIFRKAHDEGHPWSDMLQSIAVSYYNRNDPATDPGRYGCGASTWHLFLSNRKMLRVNREEWSNAIYEYGALIMRVASDAMLQMEKSLEGVDTDECLFIVDTAVKLVDEYLIANPYDERIKKLQSNFRKFLDAAHEEFSNGASVGQSSAKCKLVKTVSHKSSSFNGFFESILRFFRGKSCEQCGRRFTIGPNHSAYIDLPGVAIERSKLENGSEGVGRLCQKCGNIVCSFCNQHMPCPCGSRAFRPVRLIYIADGLFRLSRKWTFAPLVLTTRVIAIRQSVNLAC